MVNLLRGAVDQAQAMGAPLLIMLLGMLMYPWSFRVGDQRTRRLLLGPLSEERSNSPLRSLA